MDQPELKNIHTFSSDMAEAVKNSRASVITVALAEQQKHQKEEGASETTGGAKTTKIIWVLGGMLLILLGVGVTYFIFKTKTADTIVVIPGQVIKNYVTFVSYDANVDIDVTNITGATALAVLINTEVMKVSKPNTLKVFSLNNTSKDFLTLLESSAPSPLIRSLTDDYMIGSYVPQGTDGRPHLFLLFQTKDYNTAYASMLTWEQTIITDMFSLFAINISGSKKDLLNAPWKDIIINNKDARVLLDKNSNPILYYLFIDKNYFVITDNQDTIREITTRLITKNTKPL